MKIVENNLKCGEIIIFDHKFYQKTANFPSNFVPKILSTKICPGDGAFERKILSSQGQPGGGGIVTSQSDTCVTVATLSKKMLNSLRDEANRALL